MNHRVRPGSNIDLFLTQRLNAPGGKLRKQDIKLGIFGEEIENLSVGRSEREAMQNYNHYKNRHSVDYPPKDNPFILETNDNSKYVKKVENAGKKLFQNKLLFKENNQKIARYAKRKKTRGGKSQRNRTFLDQIVRSNFQSQVKKDKIMKINEKIARKLRKKFQKTCLV